MVCISIWNVSVVLKANELNLRTLQGWLVHKLGVVPWSNAGKILGSKLSTVQ